MTSALFATNKHPACLCRRTFDVTFQRWTLFVKAESELNSFLSDRNCQNKQQPDPNCSFILRQQKTKLVINRKASKTSLYFLADRTNGRAIGTVLRRSSSSFVTLCIVAKRCVLEHKLLLTAYRKSYMRNRFVPE